MKHQYEDYIAWIDEHLENLAIILADPRPEELSIWDYFNASLLANRAVLERHKMKEAGIFCDYCFEFLTYETNEDYEELMLFPCPSFLNVTNQLDEVM